MGKQRAPGINSADKRDTEMEPGWGVCLFGFFWFWTFFRSSSGRIKEMFLWPDKAAVGD